MKERLAVVGGGGAGIAAATTAKRQNPDLHVTLFTEFEDVAYSPCGIPFVHGREIESFESLFFSSTVDRYVADGLDMRMETVVTEIDLQRRILTARNQHEGFDKLIMCTGFLWEKPDVPGANLEGLHYVKNIRKAMEFDKLLDTVKRVVVIGVTPVGVEMAGNLVVVASRWTLSTRVRGRSMRSWTRTSQNRYTSRSPSTGSRCGSARAWRRFSATVSAYMRWPRPTARFRATSSSCACTRCPITRSPRLRRQAIGTTGGIVVDEGMRTSVEGVWAAGDVVEVPHGLTMIPIRGLTGSHAYAQGRTAGANAAGGSRTYDPVWVPWGLVGGDYTIGGFSFGETLATAVGVPYVVARGVGVSRARYFPGAERTHVKLLAEPDTLRLIGAQLHGGDGVKERCDFLAFVAKRGATLEDIAWMENIYSPPIGALFEPMAIAAQNGLAQLRETGAAT